MIKTAWHFSFWCLLMVQMSFAQSPAMAYATVEQFQLSPPILQYSDVLFEDQLRVTIDLRLSDVAIHYTTDGSEPTMDAPLYWEAIVLRNSTLLKARAFHAQHLASDVMEAQFVKLGPARPVKAITIDRDRHASYPGSGVEILVDRHKGTANFRSGAWMGFEGGVLEATIEMAEENSIQRVAASVLSDPNAWIFAPERVEVYSSQDGDIYVLLATLEEMPATADTPTGMRFLSVDFPPQMCRFLQVRIKHFASIPEWHPGKGTPPWLFIDEILFE